MQFKVYNIHATHIHNTDIQGTCSRGTAYLKAAVIPRSTPTADRMNSNPDQFFLPTDPANFYENFALPSCETPGPFQHTDPAQEEDRQGVTLNDLMNCLLSLGTRIESLEQLAAHSQQQHHAQPSGKAGSGSGSKHLRIRDLDGYCAPLFQRQFDPSSAELSELRRRLAARYSVEEHPKLMPSIRHWFRRRREELGQNVFSACEGHLKERFLAGIPLEAVKAELRLHQALHRTLWEACGFGHAFANDRIGLAFMLQKISSYYDRRILNKAPIKGKGPGARHDDMDSMGENDE